MKHISVLFLKFALIIIVLPTLALCIYGLIWLPSNPVNPAYANMIYPVIVGLYLSLIPFYFGVYRIFLLLTHAKKNALHTTRATKDLRQIKLCAVFFGAVYTILLPFVFQIAQKDDAPGLIIFGMFPIFFSCVVFAIFTIFQELLTDKKETVS